VNASTPTDFDSELRLHDEALRLACGFQITDRILDIGCGTGQTTRHAARTARMGSALGVDVSASSIEAARRLAGAAKLRNVVFQRADAQTHRFPHGHFDVAISRFGTMFFDDPAAAFVNIGRALRRDGRLVMLVWQARERNEWIVAIRRSLEAAGAPVGDAAEELNPFSLADPLAVTEMLEAAGYADIAFTDICEPVDYGVDVAAALEWVLHFSCTSEALKRLDPVAAQHVVRRLREMLAAHTSDDGVRFGSSAWIVTARVASRV
jgi:SAM-dependent methyltransferase